MGQIATEQVQFGLKMGHCPNLQTYTESLIRHPGNDAGTVDALADCLGITQEGSVFGCYCPGRLASVIHVNLIRRSIIY